MTVRARATLGAILIVGVALLVVGFALVSALRESLVNDRKEVAEARADEVVALLESAQEPAAIRITTIDDQLVQVLDAGGRVVASSENAAGAPALARLPVDGFAEVRPGLGDGDLPAASEVAGRLRETLAAILVG